MGIVTLATGCKPRVGGSDRQDHPVAVEQVQDQAALAEVAATSKIRYVRRAAVEKLTDQAALANLVQTDGSA